MSFSCCDLESSWNNSRRRKPIKLLSNRDKIKIFLRSSWWVTSCKWCSHRKYKNIGVVLKWKFSEEDLSTYRSSLSRQLKPSNFFVQSQPGTSTSYPVSWVGSHLGECWEQKSFLDDTWWPRVFKSAESKCSITAADDTAVVICSNLWNGHVAKPQHVLVERGHNWHKLF